MIQRLEITQIGITAVVVFLMSSILDAAAVFMEADGPGNTYELISGVLGGNVMEVPDCSHPEFGRHISEEWDAFLGKYVFVFHIHVIPDNDRCINFDRQRNEIKTYGPSPDYLKGGYNEIHTYRWKFRLDSGFQPSPNFTHIFQIKAGDGSDSGAPIITFTPRYGSPQILQLIFTPSSGSSGGGTVASSPLDSFKGEWIEAYVRTLYSETGTIEIRLIRVRDGAVLLSYANDNLDMWRGDATFNRPKWGIYRSLNSPQYLRNEEVRFSDFCIAEGDDSCPGDITVTGPVAHYTFDDGTADDSSGNGNDGLLAGTAVVVGDSVRGMVLSLDGTDGKADLGNPADLNISGPITIAAWVNINTAGGSIRNIVNRGHGGSPTRELTLRLDANGNYDLGSYESGAGEFQATTPIQTGDTGMNTWIHLAGTWDEAHWNLYRNGLLENSFSDANGPLPMTVGWAIGARGGVSGFERVFDGLIDDVRIYNSALCTNEILRIMNSNPDGDINGDRKVDLVDFSYLSVQWLSDGSFIPSADIVSACGDDTVNIDDLILLVNHFLELY